MMRRTPLPPPDHDSARYTGLTREHWEAVAEDLLLDLRPWASEDCALILPPGRPSSSGERSDGLEGFARSFLLAALLQTGRAGEDPHQHAERYARGLVTGTDPGSASAWPRPADCGQARVEAASIALALDLTRPWIWDHLGPQEQALVLTWLGEVIGLEYPPINWVWYRIVVLTFLRAEDPRFDPGTGTAEDITALHTDLERDLAVHESCAREGGWFADGPERAYDHYGTWAFAVFPSLWLRMHGAEALRRDGLITPADEERHRDRVAMFLEDALGLIGADGGPLLQGRSLIYRMAVAAPAWAAALAGLADGPAPRIAPGRLRRAASGILGHFLAHEVPDRQGLLTLGWFGPFAPMAQSYSGSGSPYWAVMGFLGLALPRDHPVWTAAEEPLPVEQADGVQVLPAPGWILTRTRADGIVRVLNHGTDHALPGELRTDSPLYARLGYSTATSPPMTGPGLLDPRDGTVAVVHPELGWSHRTGFETLVLRQLDASTALGISRQSCHWVHPEETTGDHGAGRRGDVVCGPVLRVASLVRSGTEVRIIRAETAVPLPLGVAGWPLSGPDPVEQVGEGTLRIRRRDGSVLLSSLVPLLGSFHGGIHRGADVSPLGGRFAAPHLVAPGPGAGGILAVAVHLGAAPAAIPVLERGVGGTVRVLWPGTEPVEVDLAAP